MYDLLIQNALIYDGSGRSAFRGSVAVTGGKIAAVGDLTGNAAATVDAQGLALSPGFIDVHSHADYALADDPHRLHVLRQGVTTELAGNCGKTLSPAPETMDPVAREFMNPDAKLYPSLAQELAEYETWELGPNQRYFAGHGPLRAGVIGLRADPATEEEIRVMQGILAAEMEAGAAGYSTGLSYVPGIYANTHELTELAKAIAPYGGIYTTHSRSESAGLFDSVAECIHIARHAGVGVNISHFKCVGKPFWERCGQALAMIDEANAEGLDISLDAYPYTAASTTTLTAIPPKYLDRGAIAFAKSLEDPGTVEAIRREIYEINDPSWDNSMYYVGLENFLIVRADETPWAIGKTYAEAARELGMEPFYGCMELLRRNRGNVRECRFSMCEENVRTILRHKRCMVGSDGTIRKFDVINHPRGTGTFPRYLGRYIREQEILSREEGIHRITGMPAQRYKLKGKGFIKPGYDADLTLFDYETILDQADYVNPFAHNLGIRQVYVGGVLTIENDEPTGCWNGRYLR
jgi:N-acyl-D-amino-acid deacylase